MKTPTYFPVCCSHMHHFSLPPSFLLYLPPALPASLPPSPLTGVLISSGSQPVLRRNRVFGGHAARIEVTNGGVGSLRGMRCVTTTLMASVSLLELPPHYQVGEEGTRLWCYWGFWYILLEGNCLVSFTELVPFLPLPPLSSLRLLPSSLLLSPSSSSSPPLLVPLFLLLSPSLHLAPTSTHREQSVQQSSDTRRCYSTWKMPLLNLRRQLISNARLLLVPVHTNVQTVDCMKYACMLHNEVDPGGSSEAYSPSVTDLR